MLKRKFGKTSDLLPVVSQSQKCKREKRGQGEHKASLALSSVTLLMIEVSLRSVTEERLRVRLGTSQVRLVLYMWPPILPHFTLSEFAFLPELRFSLKSPLSKGPLFAIKFEYSPNSWQIFARLAIFVTFVTLQGEFLEISFKFSPTLWLFLPDSPFSPLRVFLYKIICCVKKIETKIKIVVRQEIL